MGRVRNSSRTPDGPNTPPGFYAIDFEMEAGDKDERIYGLGQGNWTCLGGCASGCPQVPGYIWWEDINTYIYICLYVYDIYDIYDT